MTLKQTLKPEHHAILRECLRREREIAARPEPPEWKYWEYEPYLDDLAFGPKYAFGDWFGNHSNSVRQSYLRSVYELGERGFLEITRSGGGRLERVALTDEGRNLAVALHADTCGQGDIPTMDNHS